MRLAIIDLGTNSVRFDVHELSKGKLIRLLHREKMMIRLGQGLFLKGRIDAHACGRALHAFCHFHRVAERLHVEKMVAFATSALREARDGEKLIQRIKEKTGIKIKVISGKEEAKFIASGILGNEKTLPNRMALVDIGGGSMEVNLCRKGKVIQFDSFDLGTARLQQIFLERTPPKPSSIIKLRECIASTLQQKIQREKWQSVNTIVGSSGTVKAISKILKKSTGDKDFKLSDLSKLVKKMSGMNTAQLLTINGMEARRVDMILAGAILLEETALALGAKKIITTDFSLRDGILQEEIELVRDRKSSRMELHLEDLYTKARQFGVSETYIKKTVLLAEGIFDRLSKLHKLDRKWRIYLVASVILRDLGELINIHDFERHTYYIVKNADFPSMQDWEAEFVAQLCLQESSEDLTLKNVPFQKDKAKKNAFIKLLALLRIVDALDLGPENMFRIAAARVDRKNVKLYLAGNAVSGIETILMDRRKKLFQKVFKRQVVLVRP